MWSAQYGAKPAGEGARKLVTSTRYHRDTRQENYRTISDNDVTLDMLSAINSSSHSSSHSMHMVTAETLNQVEGIKAA